jgi:hypothetical protein
VGAIKDVRSEWDAVLKELRACWEKIHGRSAFGDHSPQGLVIGGMDDALAALEAMGEGK